LPGGSSGSSASSGRIEGSYSFKCSDGPTGDAVLTAVVLDGVSGARPLTLEIPIDRRLGDGYFGEDSAGMSYYLKPVGRVQPKREF
jgi:hypothetical protein